MEYKKPGERLDKKAVTAWRVIGGIYFVFMVVILVAYLMFSRYYGPYPVYIAYIIGAITFVMGVLLIGVIPLVRMYYWRYEIREHEVDIQYGIIVIRRSLIPIARIQHVDTEQGPVLRYFGLASLSVSTAGTTHKIPALKMERALQLRDLISSLAKVSDEDV